MSLPNGAQLLEAREVAECERLRSELAEMEARLTESTREKEELRKEVANCERILEVWERDGVAPMTRKELEHQRRHGVPFEAVIAEIEGMVQSSSGGA